MHTYIGVQGDQAKEGYIKMSCFELKDIITYFHWQVKDQNFTTNWRNSEI